MLINNTTELKKYIPVSIALAYEDIAPQLRMVERDTILPKFSKAVYDYITDLDHAAEDDARHLLSLLCEATAHLAVLEYLSIGQVHISSSGVMINSSQNQKTAFEWQVRDAKNQTARIGWSAIESAMAFLSGLPPGDLRNAWQTTDTYTQAQQMLIPSLRKFQQHVHLGNSHLLYQRLLPVQLQNQEEHIRPLMGEALWTRVLSFEQEPAPTAKAALTKLHRMLCRALAYETMADGFLDTVLILSDNGPLIIDGLQSRLSDAKATAPETFIHAVATSYRQKADGSVTEVLAYAQSQVAILPEYAQSPSYLQPTDPQDHIPRNDPDWGIAFF